MPDQPSNKKPEQPGSQPVPTNATNHPDSQPVPTDFAKFIPSSQPTIQSGKNIASDSPFEVVSLDALLSSPPQGSKSTKTSPKQQLDDTNSKTPPTQQPENTNPKNLSSKPFVTRLPGTPIQTQAASEEQAIQPGTTNWGNPQQAVQPESTNWGNPQQAIRNKQQKTPTPSNKTESPSITTNSGNDQVIQPKIAADKKTFRAITDFSYTYATEPSEKHSRPPGFLDISEHSLTPYEPPKDLGVTYFDEEGKAVKRFERSTFGAKRSLMEQEKMLGGKENRDSSPLVRATNIRRVSSESLPIHGFWDDITNEFHTFNRAFSPIVKTLLFLGLVIVACMPIVHHLHLASGLPSVVWPQQKSFLMDVSATPINNNTGALVEITRLQVGTNRAGGCFYDLNPKLLKNYGSFKEIRIDGDLNIPLTQNFDCLESIVEVRQYNKPITQKDIKNITFALISDLSLHIAFPPIEEKLLSEPQTITWFQQYTHMRKLLAEPDPSEDR